MTRHNKKRVKIFREKKYNSMNLLRNKMIKSNLAVVEIILINLFICIYVK